ncbi:MAG TPA: sigma-70 family RNA polymerase sigma factor [Desulfobulbaceae bacterium]|nr:sigma-70 family RNA polymerase sigma factor [Desulfobulbaceae bacterium]
MGTEPGQEIDPISWLDHYGDTLYRFARARVKDSFTAEDLVQETLLAAYRSRKKFSGRSTLKTWLIGILRHKVVDYYRKLKPEQSEEDLDAYASGLDNLFDVKEKWLVKPGDWGGDPKNVYERKELMDAIHACLDDMPKRFSLAYTLRELQGVTTQELCEFLQTGKNNCWVILYRARMLLRRCLEVNWFNTEK